MDARVTDDLAVGLSYDGRRIAVFDVTDPLLDAGWFGDISPQEEQIVLRK